MAKIKNETTEVKKVVGVADADKMNMYDKVAEFISGELNGADVYHVKPRSFKDEATGKTKKSGSYGLAFELNGKLVTLEMVVKADTTGLEDFVVTDTTTA